MSSKMKAWVQMRYGAPELLELQSVSKPVPTEHQVLVRVMACSVNAGDWHLVRGTPWFIRLMFGGLWRPGVPIAGMDVSGEVVAVGNAVQSLRVGDEVMADLSDAGFGGFADYVGASENAWVIKPAEVGHAQAAATPAAGLAALQGLCHRGGLQAGERVLIRGAASGVGSFAVQIAMLLGADVTACCRPEKRQALADVGVSKWFDEASDLMNYDLILDIAAFASPLRVARWLKPGGRYVLVGGSIWRLLQVMLLGSLLSRLSGRVISALAAKPDRNDLNQLARWLETGELQPVIDQCVLFENLPSALTALEQRQVTGKRVILLQEAA